MIMKIFFTFLKTKKKHPYIYSIFCVRLCKYMIFIKKMRHKDLYNRFRVRKTKLYFTFTLVCCRTFLLL